MIIGNNIKYIFGICLVFPFYAVSSAREKSSYQNVYFNILKQSDFDSAITSGTTLKLLYGRGARIILFYRNRPPETGHENRKLIVINDNRYGYDLDASGVDYCQPHPHYLACPGDDPPGRKVYKLGISEILSEKKMLIGGYLAEPHHWRLHGKRARQ